MNKSVFITGASRGIGYETALLFAKHGYDVGFTYLNSKENANELKNIINNMNLKCYAYNADVSDYEAMEDVIKDFIKNISHIDTLVCNAGVSPYGQIGDMSINIIKKTFEINVYGLINTSKIVSDYMIKQKNGNIIMLSSIWGITGASCESIYSATKGAIISFGKSLAKELGPSNIRVNIVAPGVVMTDMMKDFDTKEIDYLKSISALEEVSYPKDIAKSIYFLSSDDASSFTGQVISPNCGILI